MHKAQGSEFPAVVLPVGLAALYSIEGNFGVQMAAATLAFIPTFSIFLLFQRYFTLKVS